MNPTGDEGKPIAAAIEADEADAADGLPAVPTREVVKAAALAVLVLACLGVVYATPLLDHLNVTGMDAAHRWIDEQGARAPLLFGPITAVLVAFGAPRVFLAALAGAAFGFALGALVAWAATLVGCVIAFEGARYLGRPFVERRLGGRERGLGKILDLLGEHGILGNLLLRAAPVGNCLVSNLLLAISKIRRRDFLIGTALGVLPETLIYALLGSSARSDFAARITTGLLLLVLLGVVYWTITRRAQLARRVLSTTRPTKPHTSLPTALPTALPTERFAEGNPMIQSAVRIALVGCGSIASRHASALAGLESAALVMVCDLDPARAAAFAETHKVAAADSFGEMIQRDDVDAVLITAPATTHGELAYAAVECGKHVLIEKPIDVDLQAADRLIAAATARNVKVSVVSQNRFFDDVRWAHDLITRGVLGTPISASVFSLWSRDQKYYDAAPGRGRHDATEGGVVLNQAVHCVDLMLWLMGPAKSVRGFRALRAHEMAAEDTSCIVVEFQSGALGTLHSSTAVYPQEPERLELRFEHGTIVLSGGRAITFSHRSSEKIDGPPQGPESQASNKLSAFRRQHEDFAAAIRSDRDPLVTAADARAVLRFILDATS